MHWKLGYLSLLTHQVCEVNVGRSGLRRSIYWSSLKKFHPILIMMSIMIRLGLIKILKGMSKVAMRVIGKIKKVTSMQAHQSKCILNHT